MPIYEYVCRSCRHRFEVRQSIADDPISSCPQCGQAVTKVISAPAIMFKGSGWYVTDYSDKLKPGADSKTDEKGTPDQKKEAEPSTAAATQANQPAPASPAASEKPASSPAAAGSSSSTTTPATSPSSTSK